MVILPPGLSFVKDLRHASRYPVVSLHPLAVSQATRPILCEVFMFTGIIEHLGTIDSLQLHAEGGRLTIHAPTVTPHLAVANSIAVNGCCLTVVAMQTERFSADLSGETIRKTSFGELRPGMRVNLEQPMTAGKEFGGHFVLGHVDTIGRVTRLEPEGENWWYAVEVPESFARYIVPQGSIAIDGISLTIAALDSDVLSVTIIPHTWRNTTLGGYRPGARVNLECDILAKHVEKLLRKLDLKSGLTVERLREDGY